MDFGIWLVTCKPSGRPVSAKTASKYISQVCAHQSRLPEGGGRFAGGMDMTRLRAMLKGLRRSMGQSERKPRYGVRPQQLKQAFDAVLGSGSRDAANWRAALSVGLCALMRGGELGTQDGEAWSPALHLSRADVTFFRRDGVLYARIMMRPLKSERKRTSKSTEVILASGGSLIDPVRELWELFKLDPVPKEQRATAPLFRANGRHITTGDVRVVVKHLMAAVGENPARFGAHSLRIGGATAAWTAGVPPQTIRLMGRWATDCYDVYLRMTQESAARFSAQVGSTPFEDLERGFKTEELELLPEEVNGDVDIDVGGEDDDDDDSDTEERLDTNGVVG